MATLIRNVATMALLSSWATSVAAASGSGTTTRYWDCCKPSCAWNDLARLGISSPVKTCDVQDQPLNDYTVQSGCAGGGAYMCSDQTPWEVTPDMAYGFAAVSSAKNACCQCYQLTFTSGPIKGKKMVVQATNTGGDVAATQFDIAIPGGGMGAFDGCSKSWGATPVVWGAKFGGAATDECASMPSKLQAGCNFRWGWFEGADNPTVDWEEVACPAAITAKSGCVRNGDTPSGNPPPVSPIGIASAEVYAATNIMVPVPHSTSVDVEKPIRATVPVRHSSTAAAQKPTYTPKPKQHEAHSSSTTKAAYTPPPAHTTHHSYTPPRLFVGATTFETVGKKPTSTKAAAPAETGYDDECEK